jgi:hypothetical protein
VGKHRSVIALEDAPSVFNDACIRKLAMIAKLPPEADMNAFGAGIKEAARNFAKDARVPTANELQAEIAKLHKAADRQLYGQVADLLESLSPRARVMLSERADRTARDDASASSYPRVTAVGRHGEVLTRAPRPPLRLQLPIPSDLRDEALRKDACDAVARLCRIGGQFVEGRRRPSGKRSRPVSRPFLYAPAPRRNFPRRDAERNFVMLLSIAWREATGEAPSRTARHADKSRELGPFARFVCECLRLVGARYADAVELMNELHRRCNKMERREDRHTDRMETYCKHGDPPGITKWPDE